MTQPSHLKVRTCHARAEPNREPAAAWRFTHAETKGFPRAHERRDSPIDRRAIIRTRVCRAVLHDVLLLARLAGEPYGPTQSG